MNDSSPAEADRPWIATYRLQLTPEFNLWRAAEVIPYLQALGISHAYLSPCLTATPSSQHGYDVSDPTTISDSLGGPAALSHLASEAKRHGLGLLLDIVPNHMTTHSSNAYYRHVLAHGRLSRHAPKFDLYDLRRTGAPICIGTLGHPYGDTLEEGEIRLVCRDGELCIRYYEHDFPTSPTSWAEILGEPQGPIYEHCAELAALQKLPESRLGETISHYEAQVLQLSRLLSAKLRDEPQFVQERLEELNADPKALDSVLLKQHFRLMWWKLEGEFVNYRRFFNIGSLIGVRMEDRQVFDWAHQQIIERIRAGEIDGLRVDHPDGLLDPKTYFDQLRSCLPLGRIYVEKILDEEETLPADWPVDGTVGYDFMNRVNRLWMDESRTEALTSIYADFTGHPTNYLALVRQQKQFVLERHFRGDLKRLTQLAFSVASESYETRDLSLTDLEHAIVQVIVALPIYRTYLSDHTNEPAQRQILSDALSLARSLLQPTTDSSSLAFDFLEKTLLAKDRTRGQKTFLGRFQQLAPAVMAKGAEDTTFYRYDRLVSCNEVGAQPSALGISAEHFHQYLSHLHACWPHGLLTTSTHDTKRSEDVRARISVLSEIPEAWHKQILAWAEHNAPAWKGREPDRHAEYLLYQTLVGAHPLSADRAFGYLQKAAREAKLHTSWHEPDAIYEEKLEDFVRAILGDEDFSRSLDEFCQPLIHPGRVNSLAQTLIKLTAPGVPDFYQGSELWTLTLVDPDNRHPVDFPRQAELLARSRESRAPDLHAQWDSGAVKMWMIQRTLAIRRALGDLSGHSYHPLIARGEKLRHVLAYVRGDDARGDDLVVVVPRFLSTVGGDFGDTELTLPPGSFECAFSGKQFQGSIRLRDLFAVFPVALLCPPRLLSERRGGQGAV